MSPQKGKETTVNENSDEKKEVTEKPQVRREFEVHILNEDGIRKSRHIAETLNYALSEIEYAAGADGREMAIARTKLEEACFFAKKAMAGRVENQKH